MANRIFRLIILLQGSYTFITAVWPLVHISSFLEVTGPKTDIWLVKTVGALLIPVSACLMIFRFIPTIDKKPALLLGSLCSIAFICIDFYYASTDVISDVYLIDGFIQIAFLLAWMYLSVRYKAQLFGAQKF
jgi:hypothetical protein